MYHWIIQRKLPIIPVPLRSDDQDVRVDLQTVMDAAFDHGGYLTMIDYESPTPGPAFSSENAEWVSHKARAAGK